jgi:general secretion pathway protein A
MYNQFWGFREKPFKQVPNPDFLFLSAPHEEALAHLDYALAEGDGFLMITGEVGTGKSTLCRSFLNKLAPSVTCAYIFNSKLDPIQLLKSINTEFGLAARADTTHDLIAALNRFLIEENASGQKVVILIDEAQNLPVEALEQLRLLSNLETTREKLLQIVLVGQPELADRIGAFELRQLAQRINLSCHLTPLSYDETVQYIQHRLNVVSAKPLMPFDKRALKAIYVYSAGIPRLINTACERMLLAAYLDNQTTISAGMAKKVLTELRERGSPKEEARSRGRRGWVLVGVALAVAAGLIIGFPGQLSRIWSHLPVARPGAVALQPPPKVEPPSTPPAPTLDSTPAPVAVGKNAAEAISVPPQSSAPKVPLQNHVIALDELIDTLQGHDTRQLAALALLDRWGVAPVGDMVLEGVDDAAYFRLVAERHGLATQTINRRLGELIILDLPAAIQFQTPQGQALYLSLTGIDDGHYRLTTHGSAEATRTDVATLMDHWTGQAVIFWKNYMGYRGVITDGAPRSAIIVLKQLLRESGYPHLTVDGHYDDLTRYAVQDLQAKNGLIVDGLVGDRTKILLFNQKPRLPIPHLRQ